MGRTIRIELNNEQRKQLETAYRNADNHILRVRCQMILLKAENRKSKEVGQILGFCEQAVNSWLRRYLKEGFDGLKTKPGQGRIPILKVEADAAVVRLSIAEHRQRISQAQVELEETLGRKFSQKTLRRFLKNCALDISASGNVPANRKPKNFTGTRSKF